MKNPVRSFATAALALVTVLSASLAHSALDPNLVAWWPFGDYGLNDASGNGYSLSAGTAVEIGDSVALNGTSSGNANSLLSVSENTNEGTNEMNITSSVRKLTKRLSTVAVAAGVAATTLGAVGETAVYVATNGNDSASGTSEEPLKTIAAAVAKGTDAVYVNSGTYVEHDIKLDRAVRVIGLGESRDDVIVNANSAGRCFSISHTQAVVSSLTMKNGKALTGDKIGGNLYLTGGTVTNCIVQNGTSTDTIGQAGNCFASGGTIVDSLLEGGSTTGKYGSGFAIRAGGANTRVMRCIIRNASSSKSITYGTYIENGAIIENCLLTGLACGGTGRVLLVAEGAAAVNCTITGNACNKSGVYLLGANTRAVNCVSVGNGTTTELEIGGDALWSDFVSCASPLTLDGCVTVASIEAVGFNDFAAGDYSLCESSPLIGRGSAGKYLEFASSLTDITGGVRFSDGLISIGAYERAGLGGVIIAAVAGVNWVYDGSARSCVLSVVSPETGWVAKWCDVATDGESFPRDEAPAFRDPGLYTNVVRVSAPNFVDAYVTNVVYISAENTRFVAPTGNDAALGSKTDPFRTIGRALAFVKDFSGPAKVLVEDGSYIGEHDLTLDRAVEVRGISGDPAKVIVDANSAGRCFSLSHAQAVVSSLTMKNGKALTGDKIGGNLYLTGGTVTNCVVQNGTSTDTMGQAGNCFASGGTIVDSHLEGGSTTGTYGSGFVIRAGGANTRIMRCIVRNASSSKSASYGAYIEKGAIIENCLLTGLACGGTGRVLLVAEGAAAVNCTITGNACNKSGVYLLGANTRAVNCVSVGNGTTTELEIGGDALWSDFVSCASPLTLDGCVTVASISDVCFKDAAKGNYAIRSVSPLFKMGSVSAYAEYGRSDKDLSGKPRFVKSGGQKISIGAYEGSAQGLVFWLK